MLQNFIGFDKLIGTKLIKALYYLGLVGIILFVIGGLFTALGAMRYSFLGGLSALGGTLLGAVIGIVFWSFMCEIYMLFFLMSDDLRDIKNHQLGLDANNTDVDIDL